MVHLWLCSLFVKLSAHKVAGSVTLRRVYRPQVSLWGALLFSGRPMVVKVL